MIRYENAKPKTFTGDISCFSVAEVAERLGVSERQVARMIAAGDLPSLKIGRRRLIQRAAIASWMAGKAA